MSLYEEQDDRSGLDEVKEAVDQGKGIYDRGKNAYDNAKNLSEYITGEKGKVSGKTEKPEQFHSPENGKDVAKSGEKLSNEEIRNEALSHSAKAQREAVQGQQAAQRAAALSKATVAEKGSEAAVAGAGTAASASAAGSGGAAAAGGTAAAGAGSGGAAAGTAAGGPVVWVVVGIAILILIIVLLVVILFAGIGGFFLRMQRKMFGKDMPDIKIEETVETSESEQEEEYGYDSVIEVLKGKYKAFYEDIEKEKTTDCEWADVYYDNPQSNAYDILVAYGGVSMDMVQTSMTAYKEENPFNVCNMTMSCNLINLDHVFTRMMSMETRLVQHMREDGTTYNTKKIYIHNLSKEQFLKVWTLSELGAEQVEDFDQGLFDELADFKDEELEAISLGISGSIKGSNNIKLSSDGSFFIDTEKHTAKYVSSGSQKVFIEKIGNAAVEAWVNSKTKVLPSLTISQAIQESGWGESDLSMNELNFFGEKWFPGSSKNHATYRTREEIDGQSVWVFAEFVSYDTFEDAMIGRTDFFKNSSYFGDVIGCRDYKECVKILVGKNKYGARYATDSGYEASIIENIELYDLTRFDEMAFEREKEEKNSKKGGTK